MGAALLRVERRMGWLLAIALLVVPWLELWIIAQMGMTLPMILIQSLATAAVGYHFARSEQLSLWSELESGIQNGRVPSAEAIEAMLVVLGGWALIAPGWMTDLLGVAFLTPPLRTLMTSSVRAAIRARLD